MFIERSETLAKEPWQRGKHFNYHNFKAKPKVKATIDRFLTSFISTKK